MIVNKFDEIAFNIIAMSGQAKSMYMEAINFAEEFKFDEANQKILDAKKVLGDAHKLHHEIIIHESNNKESNLSLLLVHAEDIFMSAEIIGNMAEKFIILYKKIFKNN